MEINYVYLALAITVGLVVEQMVVGLATFLIALIVHKAGAAQRQKAREQAQMELQRFLSAAQMADAVDAKVTSVN